MNKDMVLKLMKKYCDKRSEYFYYKESAAEYISINYENDVEEYFIEAADELLINLMFLKSVKKSFITFTVLSLLPSLTTITSESMSFSLRKVLRSRSIAGNLSASLYAGITIDSFIINLYTK